MAQFEFPKIVFEKIDVDFEKVYSSYIQEDLYEDDGSKAFSKTEELVSYLEDIFCDNLYYYLDEVLKIKYDEILLEEYGLDKKICKEYKKFLDLKFKGVRIEQVYDNPLAFMSDEKKKSIEETLIKPMKEQIQKYGGRGGNGYTDLALKEYERVFGKIDWNN